jgi:hypothetical protein
MTVTELPNESVDIDDEELTALALAAAGDDTVADDAVPFMAFGDDGEELLPSWYMPGAAPRGDKHRGWRRAAAFAVIAAFLVIDCYGLCDTYGDLHVGAATHAAHATQLAHQR